MKTGPDIALIAALIGDPARANMLAALMGGQALTARELAEEGGVTPQTASTHLARLEEGGLILRRVQGRHRYAQLAGEEVATVLETLMGLAQSAGHRRTRSGPKDAALREARVCYNHLAGEKGVQLFDSLTARGFLLGGGAELTEEGAAFLATLGLDLKLLEKSRAPLCRACLDWSVRRSHLAGRLGRALLTHVTDKGWASRDPESRAVRFTASGRRAFDETFPL